MSFKNDKTTGPRSKAATAKTEGSSERHQGIEKGGKESEGKGGSNGYQQL